MPKSETMLEGVARELEAIGYRSKLRDLGDGRHELTLTDPDFKIYKSIRKAKPAGKGEGKAE